MEVPLSQPRLNAFLLGVFAASAALLAAIGLGGVVATTVRQRRQEIGIRMALGATCGSIQRMILKQAVVLALTGVVVGAAVSVGTNRTLEALLYDVSPTDLGLLLGVGMVLTLTAGLAALGPVWRSGKIGATVALQSDA
jgi:ABC-type antimicrobial peptide transport system permease subunit